MKVCFKPIKFSLINQNRLFRLPLEINRYAFVIFQNVLSTCVLVSAVCVPRRLSQRNKDLWRLCYLYFTCLVQFVQFSVSVVWLRSRSSLICANFSLSLISIFITNVSSQFKPILISKTFSKLMSSMCFEVQSRQSNATLLHTRILNRFWHYGSTIWSLFSVTTFQILFRNRRILRIAIWERLMVRHGGTRKSASVSVSVLQ